MDGCGLRAVRHGRWGCVAWVDGNGGVDMAGRVAGEAPDDDDA